MLILKPFQLVAVKDRTGALKQLLWRNSTITYAWSNGASTSKLTKVPIGNYNLTVTDKNACRSYRSVSLAAPSPLVITPTILSNFSGLPISCYGANDGKVF
jgi:hypothetical protein